MIRGIGQKFRFTLPYNSQYNFNQVSDVTVVFWQDDIPESEITKTLCDCTVGEFGTILYVTLSGDDSLKFQTGYKGHVQMKAHTKDGEPFGTMAQAFTVYPISDVLLETAPAPAEGV